MTTGGENVSSWGTVYGRIIVMLIEYNKHMLHRYMQTRGMLPNTDVKNVMNTAKVLKATLPCTQI